MEYSSDVQRLFMETLRFADLMVVHVKRLVRDHRWSTIPALNANEIYFCIDGEFQLVIDENVYKIDKNKMVCVPGNVYRSIHVESGDTVEFYTMQFYSEANGQSIFNFVELDQPVDMAGYRAEIDRLFGGMVEIGEPMSHAAVLRRVGYAGELLALFLEAARAEVKPPGHRSRIDFSKVMAHIDAFYKYEHISVAEMAKMARVSEGYFRREFKKEYGISCKAYIDSVRMEGALKMLRESDESLKSIAEDFKYSDTAYFSRVVKKKTGLSPTEYRKKYRTKREDRK